MSENVERIYTINLGKVLLSPDNRRSKRAINMIKEFATRHMKTEQIRIDQDLSHKIWERGIRHPPRKIRVKMNRLEDDYVLVSPYDENIDSVVSEKQTSATAPKDVPSIPDAKDASVSKTKLDTVSSKSNMKSVDDKETKVESEIKVKLDTSSKPKETPKKTISSSKSDNETESAMKTTSKFKSKSDTKTDTATQSPSSKPVDKKQKSTKSD